MMHSRRQKHSFIISALIATALITILFTQTDAGSDTQNAPVQVYSPFGLFSPGTLGALPSSASNTILKSLGFDSIGEYQDYSRELIGDLGVTWVRMDFPFNGWSFITQEAYMEKLRSDGTEVVGCVLPMNRFAPDDLTVFKDNFRQLIQKYPWVKVWQIGNEPDLSWDNPMDYPRFFFAGQQVVRETCPDCRVALAGAGARWPGQDYEGWQHALDVYDNIVAEIAAQAPDDPKPFDIIDMHYYDFYRTESGMLESLRQYHEIPRRHGLSHDIAFWVTECATPTGNVVSPPDSPYQNEDQQAAELVTRFVTMLAAQVERVAWARFYENYRYLDTEEGFFDHTGLIYNGFGDEAAAGIQPGTKKKSFYAYKTLISKLEGSTRVQRMGAGFYKFFFGGEDEDDFGSVYVLWDAGDTTPPLDLMGPVTITDLTGNSYESVGEDLIITASPVFVEKR